MRISEFVPHDDKGKASWLHNFSSKLPLYTEKYKLDPDEVSRVQQFAGTFNFWIDTNYQLTEFMKKMTQYKNELISSPKAISVPPVFPDVFSKPANQPSEDTFKLVLSISQRIKKNLGYTLSDGHDLGIEKNKTKIDPENVQPELKIVTLNAATPKISWRKNGMDRIELWVCRDGSDNFTFLAHRTRPYFIDEHPIEPGKAEIWKYKAVYVIDDHRTGEWSGVASVTVTGV